MILKEGARISYDEKEAVIISIDGDKVELLVRGWGYKYVRMSELSPELEAVKEDVSGCLEKCNQKIELLKDLIQTLGDDQITLEQALVFKCEEADRYIKRLDELK